MSKKDRITVLNKYRPLTEEELSVELTPSMPLKSSTNDLKNDEEYATEVAPLPRKVIPFRPREDEVEETKDRASGMALAGLIFSVLSLFFLPYIMAPFGIVLGYIGFRKGDQSLGIWSIGLGVIGLIGTLVVSTLI